MPGVSGQNRYQINRNQRKQGYFTEVFQSQGIETDCM